MNKKVYLAGMLLASSCLITSCATTQEAADAYQGESPKHIYKQGKEALDNKSYSEAIKRFEALDIQYPFSPETANAQLNLIYSYYKKEEYALASAAADRFIRLHPRNKNVDYAYYVKALSEFNQNLGVLERFFSVDLAQRDLTQIKKAFHDFDVIVRRFPNSHYAAPSYQYLVYLRNVIAAHELQVGRYYFDRQAYIAAVNRASDVVEHYQGSPAVKDALILMAKSYHELKLTKLQNDVLHVIKLNYPDVKLSFGA